MTLRIAVKLPTDRRAGSPPVVETTDDLARVARAADDLGYDALTVTDHPFPPAAWVDDVGHHPLDPFVALSAAAMSTSRISLQTGLLVLPYRNPFVVAKAAASLDALSGGRVVLGVAAGYLADEFIALGVDFARRNDVVDEHLTALRAAWTGEAVRFDGRFSSSPGNRMLPVPFAGSPPILIGGNSRVAIHRAVDHADGWAPMANPSAVASMRRTAVLDSPDDLAALVAVASDRAVRSGRTTPLTISFTPSRGTIYSLARSDGDMVAELKGWADAGATQLIVDVPGPTVDEWVANATFLAAAVGL